MKSPLKSLIMAAFTASLVTALTAAPPGKGPLVTGTYLEESNPQNIQSMKKGSRYALVCMECKSVSVKEVASEKDAQALCHNGGTIHCDSCKQKYTIKHVGPPGRNGDQWKMVMVNDKGKECMFIAPMK